MKSQKNAPNVTVIGPNVPEKVKLRVAAYARVSSDSADQRSSYLAQVEHYSRAIAENPDWELADVYADEGISGLSTKNREEFKRMLADCRAGKIDRILVKSVSRFARNTQDTLRYIRELLRLGVTVRFEKENIDTGKLSTEQVAAIYAAFAQMESTGHSGNMRISVEMRMKNGVFTPSSMPYGYRLKGLEPELVPEEAAVVRRIFDAALSGQGCADITRWLDESGIKRGHGRERWHRSMVGYILSNRFYTGDSVWQKTFATDTLPIRQVKNRGQKPQYHAENDHPGIVSREEFDRVQALIAARKERFYRGSAPSGSAYGGHIFCGTCGCICRTKVTNGTIYWVCNRRDDGKDLCPIPQIPECALTAAALRLHNKLALHGAQLLQPLLEQLRTLLEWELRKNPALSDIDREIANISGQDLALARLQSKGCIDPALAMSRKDALGRRLRELRRAPGAAGLRRWRRAARGHRGPAGAAGGRGVGGRAPARLLRGAGGASRARFGGRGAVPPPERTGADRKAGVTHGMAEKNALWLRNNWRHYSPTSRRIGSGTVYFQSISGRGLPPDRRGAHDRPRPPLP